MKDSISEHFAPESGLLPPSAVDIPPRAKRVLTAEQAAERDARVSTRSSFEQADSYKAVWYLCQDFVESIGYENFLFAYSMQIPGLTEEQGKKTLNGYPKPWFDLYCARRYTAIDPVVLTALATFEPFEWSDLDFSSVTPEVIELFTAAASFGVCSGMSVRAGGRYGSHGVLNMSCSNPNHRLGERRDLVFAKALQFATRALDAIIRVVERTEEVGDTKLTTRQLQAIRLAAHGKSNKEIAKVLGISAGGVEYLLSEVQEKWKVRNRVEAVAYGLKSGTLIDLNHSSLTLQYDIEADEGSGPDRT